MAYHPHHLGLRGLGQSKTGVDNTGRDAAQVVSTIGAALPGIVGLFTGQQTPAPATTPLVPMQPVTEQSGMPDWVVPAAVIGGGLVIIGVLAMVARKPKSVAANRRRRRKSSRLSRSRRSDGGLTPNYLSEAERKRIPLKAFVFPDRRAWPLDNPRRAYAAIQMLRIGRIGSAADFNKVRNAIRSRYPEVYAIYGKGLSYEKSKAARSKAKASRAKTVAAKRRTSRKAAN